MDNMEDVLQELNSFGKKPPEVISPVLEDYLAFVAKTGTTFFPWVKIKPLIRIKLERVINEFSPSTEDIPAVPNVDQFSFIACKDKVFQQLDCFSGIPFTVQRLCELLTSPKKHYKRTDKFMRALEKNLLVVSTVEPRMSSRQMTEDDVETEGATTLVNGSDHHHTDAAKERMGEPEKKRTRLIANGVAESSSSMEVDAENVGEREEEDKPAEDKDESGPCDSVRMETEDDDESSSSSSDSSSERVANVPSSSEANSDDSRRRRDSLDVAEEEDLMKADKPKEEIKCPAISGSEESSGPCDSIDTSVSLPPSADSDDSSTSCPSPTPTATPTLDSSVTATPSSDSSSSSCPAQLQQPSSTEEEDVPSSAQEKTEEKKKEDPMEESGPCDSGAESDSFSDSEARDGKSTKDDEAVQSTSPTKGTPDDKAPPPVSNSADEAGERNGD